MISKKIDKNKQEIIEMFNNTSDLVVYEFETHSNIKAMICYLEGFVDYNALNRDVLKPLILNLDKPKNIRKTLFVSQVKERNSMEDVADEMNYGKVALFFDGYNIIHTIEINKWDKRSIDEPQSEAVIKGPKEGFIEDILTNKSMVRRKLRNSNLVFEDYTIGRQTKTKVSLGYIKGIVNEEVLQEVRKRLEKIDIDSILDSGYIEELIEDSPLSLLSTITNTEKPDRVAGNLLEGRVAIFTDGTPHALIVPRLFIDGLMTSEDYYLRFYYGSFLRFMRIASMFVAIYLPGIFVAVQLYHQEMIPTVLLISMAGAREGVPLPVVLETLLMTIALELTKESGLRLPKGVGQTVSIVGALILGQAAVEAGIVSAVTTIIVAIAAISEFIIPELVQGIVLYRFVIIFLGGFAGIYGVTCGFIFMTAQLISLDSFGVPFAWPVAPTNWKGFINDTLVRLPIWRNLFRPEAIEKQNLRRQIPPQEK